MLETDRQTDRQTDRDREREREREAERERDRDRDRERERELADQTFYLTQYTDTWPTSPSADPISPGVWQGRYWSVDF